MATSPPTATDALPEDIIVTAQRRAQAANRLCISIQASPAQTLQQLRINNVRDLIVASRLPPTCT